MDEVPARVNIVTLGVADVQASAAFYERLGWRRSTASQVAIVFLHMSGAALALFRSDDLAEDANFEPHGGHGFRGVTLAINFPSREEVDEAHEAWVIAGATTLREPEDVFWGGYRGYVADPGGHTWELAYNPFFPLDEDGFIELPA